MVIIAVVVLINKFFFRVSPSPSASERTEHNEGENPSTNWGHLVRKRFKNSHTQKTSNSSIRSEASCSTHNWLKQWIV